MNLCYCWTSLFVNLFVTKDSCVRSVVFMHSLFQAPLVISQSRDKLSSTRSYLQNMLCARMRVLYARTRVHTYTCNMRNLPSFVSTYVLSFFFISYENTRIYDFVSRISSFPMFYFHVVSYCSVCMYLPLSLLIFITLGPTHYPRSLPKSHFKLPIEAFWGFFSF